MQHYSKSNGEHLYERLETRKLLEFYRIIVDKCFALMGSNFDGLKEFDKNGERNNEQILRIMDTITRKCIKL